MPKDTQVNNLIVNRLTRAQYKALEDAGTVSNTELYIITDDNPDAAVWGSISGTLTNQTDLKNALDGKQANLSTTQLNAVNSGISSTKVSTYDGYLTTISGKADKATTLSGYGITDAKIESGTVTLGSNTITPLTAESSLDATKLSGTASINTTGNAATATSATKASQDGRGNTISTTYATKTELSGKQDTLTSDNAGTGISIVDGVISNTQTSAEWGNITGTLSTQTDLQTTLNAKANTADLAAVATSGSYNDLDDKPSIPSAVTESTISGWGFTKNTGTYSKPTGGIPKTDLASAVQTSLGKADTALQGITSSQVTTALGFTPYNSTNPNGYTSNTGTVTGIKMNGASKGTSGVVDLGTVITSHQDISGKADKATTLSGYGITDAYTKTEVDNKVASVYKYKGSVASASALPTTGQITGDVYNVEDTGMNYAWDGTTWDALSTIVDLSPYAKSADLKTVATTGSYNDLTNKPSIPSAVTESTVSGWGFTKNTGTLTGVKMNGSAKTVTNGVVDLGTVITSHQDISGKANTSDLAAVATSGSYNDLDDKPTIPSEVTESTISGWGFTKNTGTYSKPTGGIPKTDLASAVQTSLGKADSALQSITSSDVTTALGFTPYNSTNPNGYTSNTGTITGITMNGASKGTSGVINLGTVITAHQDISGKANTADLATVATSGSYNDLDDKPTIPSAVTETTVSGWGFTKNTGTVTGITMNGASKGTSGVIDLGTVITSHQDISGKQDKLTAGTNITITGNTISASGTAPTYDSTTETLIFS